MIAPPSWGMYRSPVHSSSSYRSSPTQRRRLAHTPRALCGAPEPLTQFDPRAAAHEIEHEFDTSTRGARHEIRATRNGASSRARDKVGTPRRCRAELDERLQHHG